MPDPPCSGSGARTSHVPGRPPGDTARDARTLRHRRGSRQQSTSAPIETVGETANVRAPVATCARSSRVSWRTGSGEARTCDHCGDLELHGVSCKSVVTSWTTWASRSMYVVRSIGTRPVASLLIFQFAVVPSGFCLRFNGYPLLSFHREQSLLLRRQRCEVSGIGQNIPS